MSDDRLVGTWRLLSFEAQDEDGCITFPFGQDVVGFITYTSEGYMSVQFGRADRARLSGADWAGAPSSEIAAAARGYIAYCGRYEIRDGDVVHQVESSLMPNWIGGDQVRQIAHRGDTITLSTPSLVFDGHQVVATLVWQRV
jgi:hypothetical protein